MSLAVDARVIPSAIVPTTCVGDSTAACLSITRIALHIDVVHKVTKEGYGIASQRVEIEARSGCRIVIALVVKIGVGCVEVLELVNKSCADADELQWDTHSMVQVLGTTTGIGPLHKATTGRVSSDWRRCVGRNVAIRKVCNVCNHAMHLLAVVFNVVFIDTIVSTLGHHVGADGRSEEGKRE